MFWSISNLFAFSSWSFSSYSSYRSFPQLQLQFSWYGFVIGLSTVVFFTLWRLFLIDYLETKKIKRLVSPLKLRLAAIKKKGRLAVLTEKKPEIDHALTSTQFNWLWLIVMLMAVGGARAWHLISDWPLYAQAPPITWLQTWQGGLGIWGAIIGGWLGILIWHKWQKIKLPRRVFTDAAALALPWGQGLGRLGNLINSELFGRPTLLPIGIYIPPAKRPLDWQEFEFFHPLFFYEAFFSLIFGAMLWLIWKKYRQLLPLGSYFYTGFYLLGYSTIRFSLDFLRYPQPWFGPLTLAQWVSALMVLVSLVLFSKLTISAPKISTVSIPSGDSN